MRPSLPIVPKDEVYVFHDWWMVLSEDPSSIFTHDEEDYWDCWGEEDKEKTIHPQLGCGCLIIEKKVPVLIGLGEYTISYLE